MVCNPRDDEKKQTIFCIKHNKIGRKYSFETKTDINLDIEKEAMMSRTMIQNQNVKFKKIERKIGFSKLKLKKILNISKK